MPVQQIPESPTTRPRFFYGYIMVGAALLIMAVVYGAYNSFGVFFESLLTDFSWSRATISGALSLSWIMQGALSIVMGRLTDRFGPRVVLTICGFLVGLGYLLMSQIGAIWQLYLFYGVITGSGMGGSWVPIVSTIARWFTKSRNLMTGIVLTGVSLGTLIAPPVASWLISAYNWTTSYIILGGVVLVVVILIAQLLRRDPAQKEQMAYGESEGGKQESASETHAFSLREAIYTRQFWLASGMLFCFGFSVYIIMAHIVLDAIELGMSPSSAPNILATIGGLSLAGRIVLGTAADRFGNRQIFIIGFVLMAAALFWLVSNKEVWGLYVFAAVFGFSFGGCATSESPLVAGLFGLSSHGLILGVMNVLGFTLGAAIGPSIAGHIFDMTNSYQLALIVAGAMSVVGLTLTVLLSSTEKTCAHAA
jgi:OFA family oxalate/formate antiporter-like MFS transporter